MLKNRIDEAVRRMGKQERANLRKAGKIWEDTARAEISLPGHGEPSPPGSPPFLQEGELAGSLKTRVRKDQDLGNVCETGSTHFTSRMIEQGTEKMAPHPFGRKAFERCRDEMQQALGTRID